ncbi:MAG: efflux RND transporter periplasmic adaptor subunit [Pirellulales bacterium]
MDRRRDPARGAKRRRWKIALGGAATLALLAAAGWSLLGEVRGREQPLLYYKVTQADLPISVTERGNLESQVETTIRCEVENVGYDRSGNNGTQIIYIVPNGQAVKEGDLLVELDSAPIRDLLDTQTLDYQQAVSEQIQGDAKYENQKTQNETTKAEAELKLRLAQIELKMYDDGNNGTYQLELEATERTIETAKNGILEAMANLALKTTEFDGIEKLFELGYRGKGDLDESRYAFMQAEDGLASATNTLETALAERRKLEQYDYQVQKLTLEGAVASAQRALDQVLVDNVSLLAQAKATLDAADQRLAKEEERLDLLKNQLQHCKIFAPHDGMAVYADQDRRNSEIAEGTFVRERQSLLTLPDLSKMQVQTAVHESVLNQVEPNQTVSVRVDAFPDRVYRGVIESVAVLPDSSNWSSSDIKVYETVVRIEEEVEQLKPGMTAVVEIHVDRLRDVVSVPVQAIVQIEKDNWCYVQSERGVERRKLDLGRTNDKFVQIRTGLQPGEQVVLNPMDLIEKSESQRQIAPDAGAPDEAIAFGRPDNHEAAKQENAEQEDADEAEPAAAQVADPEPVESGSSDEESSGVISAG